VTDSDDAFTVGTFDSDGPTRPGVVFDPERHLDHARICPACSSLLRQCDKGWECENSECPVSLTEDEMLRLLGRATQPRIAP
jgi:hypothetical protein